MIFIDGDWKFNSDTVEKVLSGQTYDSIEYAHVKKFFQWARWMYSQIRYIVFDGRCQQKSVEDVRIEIMENAYKRGQVEMMTGIDAEGIEFLLECIESGRVVPPG